MVTDGLSADDRAGMADTITSLLPDPVTNLNTTATFTARFDDGTREYRPYPGQRMFMLRSREMVAPADTDIEPGHRIQRNADVWCVIERIESPSFDLDTRALTLQLPASTTVSTKRNPASVTPGATSGITTKLAAVTAWLFFGVLLHAVSQQFVTDTFDVDIAQPAMAVVDVPTETEAFPIAPGDWLVIGTASYPIRAVGPFAPSLLAVYVDVARSATPTP